jgi:hypothetical protein
MYYYNNKNIILPAVFFVIMMSSITTEKVFGFEQDMPNLTVPSNLEPLDLLVGIRHQFYGPVNQDQEDTALGMDLGANVTLGFRFIMYSTLEVNASRTGLRKEKNAGLSYSLEIPVIYTAIQAGINYFSFLHLENPEQNRNGFFGYMAIETKPVFDRIKPVLNFGYDNLNERYGMGAGLSITVLKDFIYLQGEIFPYVHKKEIEEYDLIFEERGLPRGPVYCTGIMIQTYGHHFKIYISNTYETGNRRLMMGTALNKLFLGFVIQRRFGS